MAGKETKQEDIRELTKNYLVGCIHGAKVSYNDLNGYAKSTVDFETDELLEEQSKLGTVIEVDGANHRGVRNAYVIPLIEKLW